MADLKSYNILESRGGGRGAGRGRGRGQPKSTDGRGKGRGGRGRGRGRGNGAAAMNISFMDKSIIDDKDDEICQQALGAYELETSEFAKALESASTVTDVPGYDEVAGQMWIYPTNKPVRDYQFQIVQTALFNNTLVSLPTGLGKTFIAAVVMYNFHRWYPSDLIVFMAPTRPLVTQQLEACHNIVGIHPSKTVELTGQISPKKREELWLSKSVFFLTPQVMTSDLTRGVCPANKIRCVVVDEAHKALGQHAYAQVITMLTKTNALFRVLALSATPGSDLAAVQQVFKNLLISRVELRSEKSSDVLPYIHSRHVDKIVVPLEGYIVEVQEQLMEIFQNYTGDLLKAGAINGRDVTSLGQFQLLKARESFRAGLGQKIANYQKGYIEVNFATAISLAHALELLTCHGLRTFYFFLRGIFNKEKGNPTVAAELKRKTKLSDLLNELQQKLNISVSNSSFNMSTSALFTTFSKHTGNVSNVSLTDVENESDYLLSHPKMKVLKDVILSHFKSFECKNETTRVMIFSQYRDSVQEIGKMLSTLGHLVKPMVFIGQSNTSGGGGKGLRQKDQVQVVQRFRDGGFNVLVSTCVGEEGLDIGEVDLIICFDASKSPTRLVQRMGRTGRQRQGRIIFLLTKGKEERNYSAGFSLHTSISKNITDPSKLYPFLYKFSPRMIPAAIDPQCFKMNVVLTSEQDPPMVIEVDDSDSRESTTEVVKPSKNTATTKKSKPNSKKPKPKSRPGTASSTASTVSEITIKECFSKLFQKGAKTEAESKKDKDMQNNTKPSNKPNVSIHSDDDDVILLEENVFENDINGGRLQGEYDLLCDIFDVVDPSKVSVKPCLNIPKPPPLNWLPEYNDLDPSLISLTNFEMDCLVEKVETHKSFMLYKERCGCGKTNDVEVSRESPIFEDDEYDNMFADVDENFISSYKKPRLEMEEGSLMDKPIVLKRKSSVIQNAFYQSKATVGENMDMDAACIFDEDDPFFDDDDWISKIDEHNICQNSNPFQLSKVLPVEKHVNNTCIPSEVTKHVPPMTPTPNSVNNPASFIAQQHSKPKFQFKKQQPSRILPQQSDYKAIIGSQMKNIIIKKEVQSSKCGVLKNENMSEFHTKFEPILNFDIVEDRNQNINVTKRSEKGTEKAQEMKTTQTQPLVQLDSCQKSSNKVDKDLFKDDYIMFEDDEEEEEKDNESYQPCQISPILPKNDDTGTVRKNSPFQYLSPIKKVDSGQRNINNLKPTSKEKDYFVETDGSTTGDEEQFLSPIKPENPMAPSALASQIINIVDDDNDIHGSTTDFEESIEEYDSNDEEIRRPTGKTEVKKSSQKATLLHPKLNTKTTTPDSVSQSILRVDHPSSPANNLQNDNNLKNDDDFVFEDGNDDFFAALESDELMEQQNLATTPPAISLQLLTKAKNPVTSPEGAFDSNGNRKRRSSTQQEKESTLLQRSVSSPSSPRPIFGTSRNENKENSISFDLRSTKPLNKVKEMPTVSPSSKFYSSERSSSVAASSTDNSSMKSEFLHSKSKATYNLAIHSDGQSFKSSGMNRNYNLKSHKDSEQAKFQFKRRPQSSQGFSSFQQESQSRKVENPKADEDDGWIMCSRGGGTLPQKSQAITTTKSNSTVSAFKIPPMVPPQPKRNKPTVFDLSDDEDFVIVGPSTSNKKREKDKTIKTIQSSSHKMPASRNVVLSPTASLSCSTPIRLTEKETRPMYESSPIVPPTKKRQRKKRRLSSSNPFLDIEADVSGSDDSSLDEENEFDGLDELDSSFVVHEVDEEDGISDTQQVRYMQSVKDIPQQQRFVRPLLPNLNDTTITEEDSEGNTKYEADSFCLEGDNEDVEYAEIGVFTQAMHVAQVEVMNEGPSSTRRRKTRRQARVQEIQKEANFTVKRSRRRIIVQNSSDED